MRSLGRHAFAVAAGALSSLGVAACTTHQCDVQHVAITGGWIVGDHQLVWRSAPPDDDASSGYVDASPLYGQWLDFPGGRTYDVTPPQIPALPPGVVLDFAATSTPVCSVADVQGKAAIEPTTDAADAHGTPAMAPADFSGCTGELAQFENLMMSPDGVPVFSIVNPTCAHYYLDATFSIPFAASDGGAAALVGDLAPGVNDSSLGATDADGPGNDAATSDATLGATSDTSLGDASDAGGASVDASDD